jgi:ADP-heptose:LPS heptosyltransferase
METTIILNGGAGRIIAAIPALEKFARLNPTDNFKVLVHGWDSLYWSHPLLQNRTFSIGQKGIFEQYIKNNKVISPEPYYSYGYYNQHLSLAEAFDEEINKTTDHSDLERAKLYISKAEKNSIKKIIQDYKDKFKKNQVLVIQPYGSGIGIVNNRPYDNSHRSLDVDDYLSLVKKLTQQNKDLLIFYFGDKMFKHPGDSVSLYLEEINSDLRFYLSLISECDYFVGIDSVGQHMAHALDKPGLVVMGSTLEKNVSYPEYFTFYRNGIKPEYSPIRLSGLDCEFADRMNNDVMNFTDDQLTELATIINRNMYE